MWETYLEVSVGIEACMHQLQLYRYVALAQNIRIRGDLTPCLQQ